jgi:hypothetical protein
MCLSVFQQRVHYIMPHTARPETAVGIRRAFTVTRESSREVANCRLHAPALGDALRRATRAACLTPTIQSGPPEHPLEWYR